MGLRLDYPFELKSLKLSQDLAPVKFKLKSEDCVLGIGLTSRCNFNCPFCYYHDNQEITDLKSDLPLEILAQILKALFPLRAISFALEGEPFCYPHFFEALDLAKEATQEIRLCTNASLLTIKNQERLKDYPISQIALSIDGTDETSYAFMHQGGSFKRFLSNAKALSVNFGEQVILSSLLCEQNLTSILELPKLAYRLGIKTLNFTQFRPHKNALLRGIREASAKKLIETLEALKLKVQEFNLEMYFDGYAKDPLLNAWILKEKALHQVPKDDLFCPMPWFYTSILSNGTLFPCCGDFKPEPIKEYTFEGIFEHEYLTRLRSLIFQGEIPKACLECSHGSIKFCP